MLHIELTPEERDLVAEILAAYYTELRGEVSDTSRHDYKEMLKQREALLKKALTAVQQAKEIAVV